ncbi:MAG: MBL fold metallo-hydrolase [Candidatus Microgenomates bacterium]|jgi:L-ascorbate metabolism protein UlaG (beta-lactamase superfamily)
MDINYLGLSSFKMKGKNASVVTDPFDPKVVGIKFPPIEADIVTVSHDHPDHNKIDLVKNYVQAIKGPGEYEIRGISILGFPSFHDDKKGELRGKNVVFVYEIDGLRICHLGDLGHNLSDEMVEEVGDIDILMIPVGGFYTIGPGVAAEIVRNIEPSIVMPMHYNTGELDQNAFGKLEKVDAFLKEIGMTVERLPRLTIKKEELGENQKVVILDRK